MQDAEVRNIVETAYNYGATAELTAELPGGRTALIVPKGAEIKIIDPAEPELLRIRQKVVFEDAASFSSYVNRFKREATRIFAKDNTITAVIDYHDKHGADYGAHVAQFSPAYSDQWKAWIGASPMTATEFAEFIEENRNEVTEPPAAALLDIITRFKMTKKVDYDHVVHQPNGDTTIAYSEKSEYAGKPGVLVPTELKLGVPVYFRGTSFVVPVLMRYRLSDGKLVFLIKVDRRRLIEDAAFEDVIASIAAETAIEVYRGALA